MSDIPTEYTPDPKGITLYTLSTPNGVKISLALSLLGLKFTPYNINISTNIQKEEWFLKHVNPNGRIPAIIDNTDGKNVRVFESGSILLYLADKFDPNHKLSYAIGTPLYYEQLQWLFFQNAGLGPMQGQANHFVLFAPEKIPYAQKRYLDETRRLYSVLERRLTENGDWLVGDHVSIADITTVGWAGSSYALGIDLKTEFPAVHAWIVRIIKLPGAVAGFNTLTTWRGFTTGPYKAEIPEE